VPLFFRLFRCADKPLRQLLYRHLVSDIRSANRKRQADSLNKAVQSFLHTVLAEPHEGAAKRAVALLAELYRRGAWTDARAVNLLAAAAQHPSPLVAVAALRFFNGADEAADGEAGSDSEGEGDGAEANRRRSAEAQGAVGLNREQVYAAYSKGTLASKKKKQAKLKREISKIKKRARKEEQTSGTGRFAALHLLHDPQGFAERLFSRAQGGAGSLGTWEARLLCLQVLSRTIGAHKLLLLNLYPFLQRYVAPHARDVTRLLAAAAQAVHEDVPPEALAPLLRTLVDGFVHDRARPEVIAVGLAAVREFAVRQPLIMTPELLQDLTQYKKHKDKAVSSASRSLVALFRDLAPGLLEKKDRGRGGAALLASGQGAQPAAFGAATAADRVSGALLLQQAEREDALGIGSGSEGCDGEGEEEEEEEEDLMSQDDVDLRAAPSDSEATGSDDADGDEDGSDDDEEAEEGEEDGEAARKRPRTAAAPVPDSLRSLKRAQRVAAEAEAAASAPKIEQERFLTDDDFRRIRAIQADHAMSDAMRRLGAKRAAAEGGQAVAAALQRGNGSNADRRVDPDSLLGTHHVRADKESRLARVHEGREGRPGFGSAAARHKKKVGGSSNKEKNKVKALPFAARQAVAKHRKASRKAHKGAHKGHKGARR
jgi:protein SDA1